MNTAFGLALVVSLTSQVPTPPNHAAASNKDDCGVAALLVMLRTQGKNVSMADVQSALPKRSELGHSMAELRDAARSFGVKLVGVQLPSRPESFNRPCLVILKGREGGHYVVVRPVGSSGGLVQVIDSRTDPEVGDAERLFRSPMWTGMALVPASTWPNIYLLLASASGILALTFLAARTWLAFCAPTTSNGRVLENSAGSL